MAGAGSYYGEVDRRSPRSSERIAASKKEGTTSASSRLLAPTRSSLAKARPDEKKEGDRNERSRRMSDVSDLASNPGAREAAKESRSRRSSFPAEEGSSRTLDSRTSSTDSNYGTRASTRNTGVAGSNGGRVKSEGRQGQAGGRHDRYSSDVSSPEKAKASPPEKTKRVSRLNTTPQPVSTGRQQGRSGAGLAESGKLIGGEKTPLAAKKEVQGKPGLSNMPTSPRASMMPTSPRGPTSPRAGMPTSPRVFGMPESAQRAMDPARASYSSGSRKDKGPVTRSTLNPSQRGLPSAEGHAPSPFALGPEAGAAQGHAGYGEGEYWSDEAMLRGHYPVGASGMETFLDSSMAPEYGQRDEEGYDAAGATDAWQGGAYGASRVDPMSHKGGAPLHQEGAHHTLAAASTLSSSSMLDSEEEATKPAAKGSLSSGAGGKQDEGSPVSVLDAMPSEVLLVKANDPMHKGVVVQTSVPVGTWHGEAGGGSSAVLPMEQHEEGLSAAAAAVAAAIGSPLPSYMMDIGSLDFMGDISGMEQDLEYVRHVLLLSGFAGKVLPPVHSEGCPIHPGVFEQLEQGIVTGSVEGAHDAIIIDNARQAEERRQRRLLFDAVNEALGRRLTPYYARPVWVKPSQAAIRKLPLGQSLLKEVWEEIHDWPVASSEEVYDILDDAARRDMSRGTERWAETGLERAEGVFELERRILEELLAEVALELGAAESRKKERRALARKAAAPRRDALHRR